MKEAAPLRDEGEFRPLRDQAGIKDFVVLVIGEDLLFAQEIRKPGRRLILQLGFILDRLHDIENDRIALFLVEEVREGDRVIGILLDEGAGKGKELRFFGAIGEAKIEILKAGLERKYPSRDGLIALFIQCMKMA